MTDEQKDIQQGEGEEEALRVRVKGFLEEYHALVNKHNIDFASYPAYIPDGQGGFKVIVQNTPVDITNQPRKSPFMEK